MPSYINTNLASLNAQRNLGVSQDSLNNALQRLSSGLRINSAKDDAAGMAIAGRMTSQINGTNQSVRNANDGISMAQTAEGAMVQIGNNLQRIRDLAVQSANASNSAADRAALNSEASQLISEIDRVASGASFNGVKLLDGTFTAQAFQVGANAGANDQISIASIASAKSAALGVGSGSSYATTLTGTAAAGSLVAGDVTLNGFAVGATVSDGVSNIAANSSGIAKANAINAVSSTTGVTASVGATTVTGTAATGFATAITAGDITINGVAIGAIAVAATAAERGAQMSAAINSKSSQTGVTATFDTTSGAVSLTAADGRNISVSKISAAATGVAGTVSGLGSTTVGANMVGTTITRSTVTLKSSTANGITVASVPSAALAEGIATTVGAVAAGDIVINGVAINAVAAGASVSLQMAAVTAQINFATTLTGVTATASATGITLASTSGGVQVVTKGSATTAVTSFTFGTSSGGGTGATTNTGLAYGYTAATATSGAGVSSLDLTTAAGATAALTTIDAALGNVFSSRASLGAYQNRFSSAVSSLATTAENLSASRSRIQDTDFAAETAALTRAQILQQAGTAMLAQANQIPNGVLALLR